MSNHAGYAAAAVIDVSVVNDVLQSVFTPQRWQPTVGADSQQMALDLTLNRPTVILQANPNNRAALEAVVTGTVAMPPGSTPRAIQIDIRLEVELGLLPPGAGLQGCIDMRNQLLSLLSVQSPAREILPQDLVLAGDGKVNANLLKMSKRFDRPDWDAEVRERGARKDELLAQLRESGCLDGVRVVVNFRNLVVTRFHVKSSDFDAAPVSPALQASLTSALQALPAQHLPLTPPLLAQIAISNLEFSFEDASVRVLDNAIAVGVNLRSPISTQGDPGSLRDFSGIGNLAVSVNPSVIMAGCEQVRRRLPIVLRADRSVFASLERLDFALGPDHLSVAGSAEVDHHDSGVGASADFSSHLRPVIDGGNVRLAASEVDVDVGIGVHLLAAGLGHLLAGPVGLAVGFISVGFIEGYLARQLSGQIDEQGVLAPQASTLTLPGTGGPQLSIAIRGVSLGTNGFDVTSSVTGPSRPPLRLPPRPTTRTKPDDAPTETARDLRVEAKKEVRDRSQ